MFFDKLMTAISNFLCTLSIIWHLSPLCHAELESSAVWYFILIKIIIECVFTFTQIFTNELAQLICGSYFPSTLCLSLLDLPSCPPAHLTDIQSSELLHNFLPTLKLSLCHFWAKSLIVMDLLVQSISKIDQSLEPCWPLLTLKSVSPIPWF